MTLIMIHRATRDFYAVKASESKHLDVELVSIMLVRLHTECPIQANYLTVEHLVLDDMFCQGCILIRSAQARWERHLLAQREAKLFRQTSQQRRIEKAGSDGHHPNAVASKLTRDGQRHTDNTTFGGRVGRLPDLTLKRGRGGSIDNNASPPTFIW